MTKPSKWRRHEKTPVGPQCENLDSFPRETTQQAIDSVSVSRVQLS
jgi:hypothetical protein